MIETVNRSKFSLEELSHGTTRHLPYLKDIPDEYKSGTTCWNFLYRIWDKKGIADVILFAKPGVNKVKAIIFIASHISDRTISKRRREAGVAYLMSKLFNSFI